MNTNENYEVLSVRGVRTLSDGSKVETEKGTFESACVLEYEVGTTGPRGGDWGHGSRVYLRLKNEASVGWQINANEDEIEIVLGGDDEIAAIASALEFMLGKLKQQLAAPRFRPNGEPCDHPWGGCSCKPRVA